MSEQKENNDNDVELIESTADHTRQPDLFDEHIKLEHRRLDEYGKRIELARHAFDLGDRQDQRQAEFAARQLEANERADIRRYNLASRVIWAATILIAAILVASIASMLFGTPEQSAVAAVLLKYFGTALGGAGVGYAMLTTMRRLLQR